MNASTVGAEATPTTELAAPSGVPPWITAESIAKANSPSTKMLLALTATGKPFYEGTVPAHVIAQRRRRNKAARIARRASR